MVDGSSLLLDLDGVVVESVHRLEDGTRLVHVQTAPGMGRDLPRLRGTIQQVHGLGAHQSARCAGRYGLSDAAMTEAKVIVPQHSM